MHRGWADAVSWPGRELRSKQRCSNAVASLQQWWVEKKHLGSHTLQWLWSMDLQGAFCISHVSESRVFTHCILAPHELSNVILPLCFAMFLLSVLGSLEGGEGPSSFLWLALGRGVLATSCAQQCTEGLVWSPWSSAGRTPVPETPVSWMEKCHPRKADGIVTFWAEWWVPCCLHCESTRGSVTGWGYLWVLSNDGVLPHGDYSWEGEIQASTAGISSGTSGHSSIPSLQSVSPPAWNREKRTLVPGLPGYLSVGKKTASSLTDIIPLVNNKWPLITHSLLHAPGG